MHEEFTSVLSIINIFEVCQKLLSYYLVKNTLSLGLFI